MYISNILTVQPPSKEADKFFAICPHGWGMHQSALGAIYNALYNGKCGEVKLYEISKDADPRVSFHGVQVKKDAHFEHVKTFKICTERWQAIQQFVSVLTDIVDRKSQFDEIKTDVDEALYALEHAD